MSSDTSLSSGPSDIQSDEKESQIVTKPKKSWFKRILFALFLLLLLLTIGLVVGYVFRIPLINYALQNNLPDGIAVSIGKLDIAGLDRNITLDDVSVKLKEPAYKGTINVQLDHIALLGLDYAQLEQAVKKDVEQKLKQEAKETEFSAQEFAKKSEQSIRSLLTSISKDDSSRSESPETKDASANHNVLAQSFYIKGIDVSITSPEMSLAANLSLLELKGIDYTYREDHDVALGAFELNNIELDMRSNDLTLDLNLSVLGLNQIDYAYLTSAKDPMDQHDASIEGSVLSNLDVKLNQEATKLVTTFRQLSLGNIQFKQAIADLKKLELDTLKVDLSQPDVPVNNIDLASLDLSNVNVAIEKGDVTLESLNVKQVDTKLDEWQWLTSFSAFELNRLSLNNWSDTITLASTKLSALELDIKNKETVLVPELSVADISLKGQKLGIDSVHILSPQLHLVRKKDGTINLVPPVNAKENKKTQENTQKNNNKQANDNKQQKESQQKESQESQTSEEAKAPFEYVINRLLINNTANKSKTGNKTKTDNKIKNRKNGYVRWVDNTLDSPVDLTLSIDELKVTDIDSNSHKQARAVKHRVKHKGKDGGEITKAAGKTHAMLQAKLSGDSPLNADAWFDVATVETDFAAIIDLKHMELPLVSPYTVDTIGYKIQSGQFSTHVDIAAISSKLDGNINLKLLGTDLKPADKDTMERFNKELTMPLPTALNLLEDGDKAIKLDMPLKGDIDDPSFSPKGVMRFVTMKAIKEATVYYVKTALLPQNTLFTLVDVFGGMVYDKLTELPAMKFKKSEVELNSAHKAFLNNVAKMMIKKHKLRFKVCALASPNDGTESISIALGNQRSKAIRQYLIQEHKIATDRLMQCLPSYKEKLKQSEVKLML